MHQLIVNKTTKLPLPSLNRIRLTCLTAFKAILSASWEAGDQGTPGSTRAEATSFSLARNISLNSVMNAADWSRSTTLFRHYMRLLPAEVLANIASRSAANVQDAVLAVLK